MCFLGYFDLSIHGLIAVPGIIGCLQALEAIKIASSVGEPLSGRMLLFDALSARIRIVSLPTSSNVEGIFIFHLILKDIHLVLAHFWQYR